MEDSQSSFLRHCPCTNPTCGSSDGNSEYTDGHLYCHVCGTYTHPDGQPQVNTRRPKIPGELVENLEFKALSNRKLTEETCRKWSYGIGTYEGRSVQIATYRDLSGNPKFQKVRKPDKDFVILGDASGSELYGMHLWRDGGKKLVVTEGEVDALTVSQMQDHKWPVVSIPTGSKGAAKSLKKNLEWLEKFDEVVFMFDMDEPGQAAAKECAELLTPGKAKIASLSLKDPNELLKAGRGGEIIKAMWDAKTHRPDGIVAGAELWERYKAKPLNDGLPFPYSKLQAMTKGIRKGEVVLFAAGSGIGKTEVVRQVTYSLLMDHLETVGLMHLEESLERTIDGFVGLHLGKRTHIVEVPEEERKAAFNATVGNGRVYLYDHFGSTGSENLFAKIRYFARGCGCTTIILDHLSIIVSGIEEGDERRLIDNIMTKLATLAQELKVRIIVICHLKKPEGKPHEEGGKVSLDDFRGSGSIKQLAHTCIGLERDQQDDTLKHYTRMRLLKCRWTGETGDAGWLKWNPDTGRLEESDGPPGEGQANEDF